MSGNPLPESQVLAQADALMRRHRVFVAGGATAPQSVEEDIPVLTDIVPQISGDDPSMQREELEQRLRDALVEWIDEALPQEVLKLTDNIADQLLAALDARLRNELVPRLIASLGTTDATSPSSGSTDLV